jgi:predicted membrane-bound dolichyl-phosphate-mannose-protein mannosyltransferase
MNTSNSSKKTTLSISSILFGAVSIIILVTLFLYSYIFTYSYSQNREQLTDLFNFSQWRIPQSTRVISDEKLYQVAADYIVRGNNLYDINPEVPPLGKYLYGLSIIIFDNPYITSIALYLIATVVFILLAKQAQFTTEQIAISALLLLTTPLFFSQLSQTMLDLPQLLFVLLHCYFFVRILGAAKTGQQMTTTLAAGLLLGLAAAIKFPIFVIVIGCVDAFLLLFQRKVRTLVYFGIAAAAGYILPFTYYISTHSFMEFLGAQKWMVHFYRGQYSEVSIWGNVVHYFTGIFSDYAGTTQRSEEWSIVLPLIAAGVCIYLFSKMFKNVFTKRMVEPLDYYALLFIALLFPLFFLSLYTRYFVLVLPFGLLCLTYWYTTKRIWLYAAIALISLIQSAAYIRPQPLATLKFAVIDWKNGNYQDFYSHLTSDSQNIDRASYLHKLKVIEFATLTQTQSITLNLPATTFFTTEVDGTATIEYMTHAGKYTHTAPAHFKREEGVWKIKWDWNLIADGMNSNDTLTLVDREKPPGSVVSTDKIKLAYMANQPYIYVNPDKIADRNTFIHALSSVSGQSTVALENLIFIKGRSLTEVPIGVPKTFNEPQAELPEITYEAYTTKEKPVRRYDPRLSKVDLTQIQQLEDKNRDLLGLAPLLVLKKASGDEKLLLGNPAQITSDIVYPFTSQVLFLRR